MLTIYQDHHQNNINKEELEEFVYEFHERVLGIEPEQTERPEWDWIRKK